MIDQSLGLGPATPKTRLDLYLRPSEERSRMQQSIIKESLTTLQQMTQDGPQNPGLSQKYAQLMKYYVLIEGSLLFWAVKLVSLERSIYHTIVKFRESIGVVGAVFREQVHRVFGDSHPNTEALVGDMDATLRAITPPQSIENFSHFLVQEHLLPDIKNSTLLLNSKTQALYTLGDLEENFSRLHRAFSVVSSQYSDALAKIAIEHPKSRIPEKFISDNLALLKHRTVLSAVDVIGEIFKFYSDFSDYMKTLPDINFEYIDTSCIICFDRSLVGKQVFCGHIFHQKCIYTWLVTNGSSTCPICRRIIGEVFEENREILRGKIAYFKQMLKLQLAFLFFARSHPLGPSSGVEEVIEMGIGFHQDLTSVYDEFSSQVGAKQSGKVDFLADDPAEFVKTLFWEKATKCINLEGFYKTLHERLAKRELERIFSFYTHRLPPSYRQIEAEFDQIFQ